MHLDDDPTLEAIDALADTLAAARLALETMAASSLGFSAQARIHRESTRLARAWVREHIDLSPLPDVPAVRDETDEILRQTVDPEDGSGEDGRRDDEPPLDTGPEGAADDTPPLTEETGEAPPVGLDVDLDLESSNDIPLVAFDDDDLMDDDVDVDSLVQGLDDIDPTSVDDETEMSSDAGLIEVADDPPSEMDDLVSFADESEGESLVSFSDESSDDLDSVEDLLGASESDDLVQAELDTSDLEDLEGELVTYDDESIEELGLVTLDAEDAVELIDEGPIEDADDEDTPSDEGGVPEGTLVADLASLVQLKDLLEDDGSGALAEGERPATPRGADPRLTEGSSLRVTTTLTDEDLGKLGFSSRDDLVSPEGSDADPNSETGSQPHVRVDSATPPPTASASRSEGTGAYSPPAGASVSIPTIRDSGASATRPTAAAVRINPDGGGGAVIEEQEVLALGEADDDLADDAGAGLSLDVEEYEFEDEEVELEDVMPEIEPDPEPMPMPELSAAKEQDLLQKAHMAYQDGKLQEATELYSDVLDFDPDNADAALGRGRAYLDLADYARAMSDFTVAEDLRPDDPDTNAAIGELYYARKDYGRAIDYFDRALNKDPKHAMAWCRRGIAHYYRKDYDQAYDDLVKAQKLDDGIPNIRTYIGMVKKKRR